METVTGDSSHQFNAEIACKIRPPTNYLRTWKQGRNLEKLNEIEDDGKIDSDENLIRISNQVVSNYVIMKNVLMRLRWQDLKLCSTVSKLWRDIAVNIQKDKHVALDFFLVKVQQRKIFIGDIEILQAEPLLVLTFFNKSSQKVSFSCEDLSKLLCSIPNPSGHKHKMLDYINLVLCYPNNSMLGIYCSSLVFVGKLNKKSEQSIFGSGFNIEDMDSFPFIGGLVIPKIEDLVVFKFKEDGSTIRNSTHTCKAFERITNILRSNIVKCVFVFVMGILGPKGGRFIDKYIAKMRELQPSESFALGGCAVNAVVNDNFHNDYSKVKNKFEAHFVVLAIPKSSTNPENFKAYSVLMEDVREDQCAHFNSRLELFSSCITKQKHNAGVKLSCVDRLGLHRKETLYWKKYFPKTSLVGCYGLGEIGADCFPGDGFPREKRAKTDREDSVIYSYSTVLVYLAWGDRVK